MMRRSAGFDADEARRQPLKEWQNVPALELTANDYITCRVNSVDLKNRLGHIETDCRDRLHVWLLRIVGALTAPTSMAFRAGGGAVHSIRIGHATLFDHLVGRKKERPRSRRGLGLGELTRYSYSSIVSAWCGPSAAD